MAQDLTTVGLSQVLVTEPTHWGTHTLVLIFSSDQGDLPVGDLVITPCKRGRVYLKDQLPDPQWDFPGSMADGSAEEARTALDMTVLEHSIPFLREQRTPWFTKKLRLMKQKGEKLQRH